MFEKQHADIKVFSQRNLNFRYINEHQQYYSVNLTKHVIHIEDTVFSAKLQYLDQWARKAKTQT